MLGPPCHSLPDIIQEIAKEDEEKQKRHLRRVVAKQERLKSCPPRLGRHKYELFCVYLTEICLVHLLLKVINYVHSCKHRFSSSEGTLNYSFFFFSVSLITFGPLLCGFGGGKLNLIIQRKTMRYIIISRQKVCAFMNESI